MCAVGVYVSGLADLLARTDQRQGEMVHAHPLSGRQLPTSLGALAAGETRTLNKTLTRNLEIAMYGNPAPAIEHHRGRT